LSLRVAADTRMALAADTPGRPTGRVVVARTAVQDVDNEPGACTGIRVGVEPDMARGAAATPRSKPRKSRQRRKHGFKEWSAFGEVQRWRARRQDRPAAG
jgi:hypothetical protein